MIITKGKLVRVDGNFREWYGIDTQDLYDAAIQAVRVRGRNVFIFFREGTKFTIDEGEIFVLCPNKRDGFRIPKYDDLKYWRKRGVLVIKT